MNLPVVYVNELLQDNNELMALINNDSDKIFIVSVDEDFQKKEKLPIIRINQLSGNQTIFASGIPKTYSVVIQVDVWADKFKTLEQFHNKLDKLFASDGWACIESFVDKDESFNGTPRLVKRYKTTQLIEFE